MANSIGSAALILSTESSKLSSGLQSSTAEASSWAGKLGSTITGKLSGIGSSILGSLKGGVAGLAAGFGVGAIKSSLDSLGDLAGSAKMAKGLGISSEKYGALSMLAKKYGVEQEQMNAMFAKTGKASLEAAGGNEQFAASFQRLGLNAKEVAGKDLGSQFTDIVDGLSKIQNPAERAKIGMQLFGEQASKLMPVFSMNSAEIQKYQNKVVSSGQVLTQNQADSVMAAKAAQAKLGALWDGLSNKMTVAMAPVLEVVGTKISSAVEALAPAFSFVGDALAVHWGLIASVVGDVLEGIWSVAKAIGGWVAGLFDMTDATISAKSLVVGVWKVVASAIGYTWDVLKAGAAAISYVASYVVDGVGVIYDVFAKILKMLDKLPDRMKPTWLKDYTKAVGDFGAALHRSGDSMRDWSKGVFSNFGSQGKAARDWITERANRRGNKNDEKADPRYDVPEANKEAEKEKLRKAVHDAFPSGQALLGTQEAYKIEAAFKFQASLPKDGQERANSFLQRIANAVEKQLNAKATKESFPDF